MKTIIGKNEIAVRVAELGREISAAYRGREVTMLTILNGGIVFAADLMRSVQGDIRFDTMAVSSYAGTASSGVIEFRSRPKLPLAGKTILVIDDILDTGRTMLEIKNFLREAGAADVRSCVLLDKDCPKLPGATAADYRAFTVPDVYVAGYGLDADEKYRQLADIVAPFA